jgi:succinate dehydrogenase / fumarate reductase cytochrome b subunit
MSTASPDFFAKHEFLIRRLHSLSGLVPVGAYMTVHLLVNSTLLNGPGSFQTNVYQIHSLGKMLPLVEWLFIFLPIIFHAVIGVWIIRTGKSNVDHYRYVANWRYTLQRISGVIAIFVIFFHVFHLHGWFHGDWWLANVAEPLGMAQFRPYNAASTLARALSGWFWPVFYFVGILASVFHFANGVWTMGITWGVWISPRAQRGASYVCAAGGAALLLVGISALVAAVRTDANEAERVEKAMYEAKAAAGEVIVDPHKQSSVHSDGEGEAPEEPPKPAHDD